jgi:hypothetical protein
MISPRSSPRCTTARSTAKSHGCWTVKIGDQLKGYVAEGAVASVAQAAEWFRDTAMRFYPKSEFAQRYQGFVQ